MKQVLLAGAALLIGVGSAFAAITDQTGSTANPPANLHRTTDSGRLGSASNGTALAVHGTGAVSGDVFATIPAQEDLSSKVVGLDIYNNADQDIGKIKDIAFAQNGVSAYIVAVGGFLGMGETYHPLPWPLLNYDTQRNAYVVSLDKEQLSAAPSYSLEELADLGDSDERYRDPVFAYYANSGVPAYW